uniref:ATP synthase complex subunit 8 n=1 Tax=Leptocorisa lepida TaxID=702478 RepID=A0A8T9EGW7_9HEMI|nr:ATP synthase F0 subunit 8 [Leptocorisa lepida]UNA68814.1 ATP synthase F0 subunit 8 [Leptocorisa lepida]
MPQMAPIWWEMLFLMFLMMFMLMNSIIYFNKTMTMMKMKKESIKIKQIKWKW